MSLKLCFVVLFTMEIFSYQAVTIVTLKISKLYKIMLCDVVIMYMIIEVNILIIYITYQISRLLMLEGNIQNKSLKVNVAVPTRYSRAADGPTLHLSIPGTELFKKSVYYYGATLWNTLPVNIQLHDNIDNFKFDLYKHIT